MSRSPHTLAGDSQVLAYDKAWSALNMLIREGHSFSGHERNCAYLNLGSNSNRFANISGVTGLDLDDDGRGLAHCDWDGDGDLDLWLTNRTGPRVRFLRNDSSSNSNSIAFRLRGTECNRDAIGARLVLTLDTPDSSELPTSLHKSMRAGHGHLSQSSKWIHFGLGKASPRSVTVKWPGGEAETFEDLLPGSRYQLVQGSGQAVRAAAATEYKLASSEPKAKPTSDGGRIVLLRQSPVPELTWQTLEGESRTLQSIKKPVLLNLWATWCGPCAEELKQWADSAEEFRRRGLDVVAVSVDEQGLPVDEIRGFVEKLDFPFPVGRPSEDLIEKLETLQRTFIGRQADLPIPSSFLFDESNQLVAIYRGPIEQQQLFNDLDLLGADDETIRNRAVPFAGRWLGNPRATEAQSIALKFLHRGQVTHALDFAHRLVRIGRENRNRFSPSQVTQFESLIGAIYYDSKNFEKAIEAWSSVLEASPSDRTTRLNLARAYKSMGKTKDAIQQMRIALRQRREDPENLAFLARFLREEQGDLREVAQLLRESNELAPSNRVHFELSQTLAALGDIHGATSELRQLLKRQPDWPPAANNLAWILAASPDPNLQDPQEALRLAIVAAEACNYERPYVVGTLAAAYAANDDFKQATEFAQKAIQIAKDAGDDRAATRIQPALESYQSQRPYRDPGLVQRQP